MRETLLGDQVVGYLLVAYREERRCRVQTSLEEELELVSHDGSSMLRYHSKLTHARRPARVGAIFRRSAV